MSVELSIELFKDTFFYENSDILNMYTTSQKIKFLGELRESIVSTQSIIDQLRNKIFVHSQLLRNSKDDLPILKKQMQNYRSILFETLNTYNVTRDLIEKLC